MVHCLLYEVPGVESVEKLYSMLTMYTFCWSLFTVTRPNKFWPDEHIVWNLVSESAKL